MVMRGMPASKSYAFQHLYTRFSSGYCRLVGDSYLGITFYLPINRQEPRTREALPEADL
jgi:hypothetical protein